MNTDKPVPATAGTGESEDNAERNTLFWLCQNSVIRANPCSSVAVFILFCGMLAISWLREASLLKEERSDASKPFGT